MELAVSAAQHGNSLLAVAVILVLGSRIITVARYANISIS